MSHSNKQSKTTLKPVAQEHKTRDRGAREAKTLPIRYFVCPTSIAVGSKYGKRSRISKIIIRNSTLARSNICAPQLSHVWKVTTDRDTRSDGFSNSLVLFRPFFCSEGGKQPPGLLKKKSRSPVHLTAKRALAHSISVVKTPPLHPPPAPRACLVPSSPAVRTQQGNKKAKTCMFAT